MKKQKSVNEIENINSTYKKSNILINAKYKTTIREQKIYAYTMMSLDKCIEDQTGALIYRLKANEIKKILGLKGNSIYRDLKKLSNTITSRNIGYVDPETKFFDYMSLVIRAKYENGELEIVYNPYIKEYIQDIRTNYTRLPQKVMLSFTNVHSFRLYEILLAKSYDPIIKTQRNNYIIEYDIDELRFDLGLIDTDSDEVKELLKGVKPDYKKAKEIARKKSYMEWRDFKRDILDLAIEEINKISDMEVKVEAGNKIGLKGKIESVRFIIELQTKKNNSLEVKEIKDTKKELTQEEKDSVVDFICDLIDIPLKMKDYRAIAEASDYNVEIIEKAYSIVRKKKKVDNFVGYMISAIKENYQEAVEYSNSNSFNNILKQDYDFEELEKDILSN